ncbi:hypothetical protein Pint_03983 [Pistacia integerrima]|uniref:Uncharacterized protein n=1 Tax=Pistacia integerrima TaxID=434235 RepID=A0ACC0Z5K6_9ROSI|nr:hypothetical protein Pint_03983 [Pistacia integerrima]
MAAPDDSSSSNPINDEKSISETNPNPSSSKSLVSVPSGSPAVCLVQFASDSFAGAFMGSIFGYGSGLVKKKGFKGSFGEAGSYAKVCEIPWFLSLGGFFSLVRI